MIGTVTKRGRRVTLADVAREASLSVPTVDRVLNRRAPVRPETANRVHDAARRLGFHGTGLLAQRLASLRPRRTLGFLLQAHATEFYRLLADAIRAAVAEQDGQHAAVIEHMDDLRPASVAARVREIAGRCEALAVVAADHPAVTAAVAAAEARGIGVYTLLSDLNTDARAGYFGLDHRKAGRTAGWFMTRLVRDPGEVAIVVGSHRYGGHELCEMAFRAYLREHAPAFRLLEPLVSFENRAFAHEATLGLLNRHPALRGIYVPGGGIEGVIEALRDRPGARHVTVVAMDLFIETSDALLDGVVDVVLATPVAAVARGVVAAMLARLEGRADVPQRAALPFATYVSENI